MKSVDIRMRHADKTDGVYVNWFSDNMALSSEVACDETVIRVINIMGWLQARFALAGIFLRGGIAKGMHHHEDNIDFGPALVEAVVIEKYGSVHEVRIKFSDSLKQQIVSSMNGASNLPKVLIDKRDDSMYLDFLESIQEPAERDILSDIIRLKVGELPQSAQTDEEIKVRKKLEWLCDYFEWSYNGKPKDDRFFSNY